MIPRGIRNNNPLNIRRSRDQWKGLRAQQRDKEFCQFESMSYGFRAAFVILTRTYYQVHHLATIRAIVGRWAPPTENNTPAYIAAVCRLTGIGPDEPLGSPTDHPARWMLLAAAMAVQELGTTQIDWWALLQGWLLM